MCGIVGAVSEKPVVSLLLDGLKKLEYRGYDSAGMTLLSDASTFTRYRVVGKVRELEKVVTPKEHTEGTGIAHTRWATHGALKECNAHPFISNDAFALAHNGIIENNLELREDLIQKGYQFSSQTDSEVIVHLIHYHFQQTQDVIQAIAHTLKALKGAYALGILSKAHPGHLFAARSGSPLLIGKGHQEAFLASDALAFSAVAKEMIYMEEGDIANISKTDILIYDASQTPVNRAVHPVTNPFDMIDRGVYRHYMQKEIMEQPVAITACLEGRLLNHHIAPALFGEAVDAVFHAVQHVQLVACGTSYYAAMVARYWIESLAGIPCTVEIASEFRYRDIAPHKNSLFIALSQSGETADTLAALRLAKQMHYLKVLAISNVPDSSLVREADGYCLTRAGLEIGVASTKTFTTQLIVLFLLALTLKQHHAPQNDGAEACVTALKQLPDIMQKFLQHTQEIAHLANAFARHEHALFIGRGPLYPVAMEGALKMKELSYIHAEGYPAGELKHGPLALVDEKMPVVALCPKDKLFEKTISNIQEIYTRNGQLFILTDEADYFKHDAFKNMTILSVPTVHPLLTPLMYTLPMQLIAYYTATAKGTDVDQPRNLAKSVTVE